MRLLRRIWQDLLNLNSQLELAVKITGSILGIALIVAGWYIGKDWWNTQLTISRIALAGIMFAVIFLCYLASVAIRIRRPYLIVGDLMPDEEETGINSFFQMRVENRGPGTVRPIVRVTYLRDGYGRLLPVSSAYLGEEIHWRYWSRTDAYKYLREGDEAYAGVFWLVDLHTEEPKLAIYPIYLKPIDLWDKPIRLIDQSGLRVKISTTYQSDDVLERDTPVVKRSYVITPDPSQRLKYRARRVRFRSLFWR